jgi:sulfite dehydrogenase
MTTQPPLKHLALTLALTLASAASAQEIQLPQDTATYTPSPLPGYQRVQQNCLICHSAHYVLYQPESSTREYWESVVKKMKHPFGALFADEDVAPMVDYLVKTYGAERSGVRISSPSTQPR